MKQKNGKATCWKACDKAIAAAGKTHDEVIEAAKKALKEAIETAEKAYGDAIEAACKEVKLDGKNKSAETRGEIALRKD